MKRILHLIVLSMMMICCYASDGTIIFSKSGYIYRLGKGDYVKSTLYGLQMADGTTRYLIPKWYGEGSKDLEFTISEKGDLTITNSTYRSQSMGPWGSFNYYDTGLEDIVMLWGSPGYDVLRAYADGDKTKTLSAITDDTERCLISIKGDYGIADNTGATVTDPNGKDCWVFDTDPAEYAAWTSNAKVTFTKPGYIYRLGKGDFVKGSICGLELADGTTRYFIPSWYGEGSKDLEFTISEKGELTITNSTYRSQSMGPWGSFNYYDTGLEDIVMLWGSPGYDVLCAYADGDKTKTLSAITNDTERCLISIKGDYGIADNTGATVTDPNGKVCWTFDTDATEYKEAMAINTPTVSSRIVDVRKHIENGQIVIERENGQKYNVCGQLIK